MVDGWGLGVEMRRVWILIALFLVLAPMGCSPSYEAPRSAATTPKWSLYFSPHGGCTDAIVNAIGSARKTVLVQAYSFTSTRIAKALLDAKKRGVDVRVILDKSQSGSRYCSSDFFLNSGVPTRIDCAHAIAHNKVMIIDGSTVITGSFNFTKAAEEHNAENLLIIRDSNLAARYTANWKLHSGHSKAYRGRGHSG